ncbi:hypothetical protein GCM10028803_46220 [Larkinella knui]
MISYCVNATDFADHFNSPGSADRYRPYFIRVNNWQYTELKLFTFYNNLTIAMDNFDEQEDNIFLPNENKHEKLREAFINLLSSVDSTINWSKVQWDYKEGEGFGSCTSDDLETRKKLQAAFYFLNPDWSRGLEQS